MIQYFIKLLFTSVLIVGVTELTKRTGPFWGGIVASLPLVSLMSFVWLYAETRDSALVGDLSWSIFWLVIPSLALFASLPALLKRGYPFPMAFAVSILLTTLAYLVTAAAAQKLGIRS